MRRNDRRWLAAGAILQIMALGGCGKGETPAAPDNAVQPAPVASVARPQGDERLVLAFGDSLYAGYGLGRGQDLPDVVQGLLRAQGINATVVNAGVSGDTTAAGRQRLAFALDNLPREPDLVLLGLGGNDVLRQLPLAETRANMAAMMAELDRRGIRVVLTGMRAPPNLGPDYVAPFDAIWPTLAKRYDAPLYPFILDGVIGQGALMQGDRVHPSADGVKAIAARLSPVVAEALAAKP